MPTGLIKNSMAIFIVIANLVFQAKAQGNFKFHALGVENGLSQNVITSITQDKDGFMWFGTLSGLNRYDGYLFTPFQFNPHDTNSLAESWILSLACTADGNVLAGTRFGGLNRYDPVKNNFIRYLHDEKRKNSISDNVVNCVLESKSGKIFAGTEAGLSVANGKEDNFKNYINFPGDSNSIAFGRVSALLETSDGSIWVAAGKNTLCLFHSKTEKFSRYTDVTGTTGNFQVYEMMETSDGLILLATDKGLRFFDKGKRQFVCPIKNWSRSDTLLNGDIGCITKDLSGRIWCGVRFTQYSFAFGYLDLPNKKIEFLKSSPDNTDSYTYEAMDKLFTDKSGVVWIGYNGKGLNYFHPVPPKFEHIAKKPGQLNSEYVYAVHEDEEGSVWMGTSDFGVNRYFPKTGKTIYYEKGLLLSNWVTDIEPCNQNELWISFKTNPTEGGVLLLNKETGNYKTIDEIAGRKQTLSSYLVRCLLDEGNVLWAGTVDGGLNKYDKTTKEVSVYKYNKEYSTSIAGDEICDIFRDSKKRLWIGTRNGLSLMDEKTNQFKNWTYNYRNPNSISNNFVLQIYEDSDQQLWVSTGHGLNKFDPDSNKFTLISTAHGLPDDHIYGILEDNHKNFWVSTNNGLALIYANNKGIRSFTLSDGLQSKEFNTHAWHKGKNGKLYFGGINGVNVFHPDSIHYNSYIAPVKITGFSVFGKPFPLDSGITTKKDIHLQYRENFITFDFASLDYIVPEKNEFACFLEGFDRDWIYLGHRHTISYSNLDPGKYILRVKATNDDGLWNETGTTLTITIHPPFYRTTWFYILSLAIILFLIWWMYRMRVKNFVQTQKNLELQVQQRTSEINRQKEELAASHKNISEVSEVGKLISSSLDIDDVMQAVYDGINRLMNAQFFGLAIFNEPKGRVETRFFIDHGKRLENKSIPINSDSSISAWCIRNRKEVITHSQDEVNIILGKAPLLLGAKDHTESIIMLPLISGNRCLGAITVQSYEKNAFTEYDVNTIRSIASYTAVALDNSAAYEIIQEAKTEMERLSLVAQKTDNGVTICDAEGNTEWVNEGFTRMHGYTLKDIKEKFNGNIYILTADAEAIKIMREGIASGKSVAYEYNTKNAEGQSIWIHTSLTPIKDEHGVIKKLVAIDSDVTVMKMAEEAVKASEEQYRILFDRNGDFIFVYDKATHFILDCNQTIINRYGYSKSEFKKMTPFDLHPKEEQHTVALNIDVESPEIANYYTHITKHGERVDVEARSVEIDYLGRSAWLVMVRDITERKKSELKIKKQRDEIEAKNKDITDSIHYAKRIQEAMLTTDAQFDLLFDDHFVLFKPRDIVSGDFYWVKKSEDGKIFLATADCTGHGVPGAIMSVIGSTKLDQIIVQKKIHDPADALWNLREEIINLLNPFGAVHETEDGIDMVLCSFQLNAQPEESAGTLEFACAKNPLWIIRNQQLIEYNADNFCVGKDYNDTLPFTKKTVELKKGDCVYTFSDGYADQFGGPKGKKFKYKKLQELLLSIAHEPMFLQKQILDDTIEKWRGEIMQIDDICVIGIKI